MGRKPKIEPSYLFDYGFDIGSRTVYFGPTTHSDDADVSEVSTASLIKAVHLLDQQVSAPIRILLNSTGGSVYDGLAAYDFLKSVKSPIIIEVVGTAMSMAAVVLQAGDWRIIHEHAYLMVHDGTDAFEGKPKDASRWTEHGRDLCKVMYGIFEEKTGQDVKYWYRKCDHDWILSAKQALQEKLVDEIIPHATKENWRKK